MTTSKLWQDIQIANDEAKKQQIITDYKNLAGDAATEQDFDMLLMVEYPNMASLDGLRDKMDHLVPN
jgi:hypothetical protein